MKDFLAYIRARILSGFPMPWRLLAIMTAVNLTGLFLTAFILSHSFGAEFWSTFGVLLSVPALWAASLLAVYRVIAKAANTARMPLINGQRPRWARNLTLRRRLFATNLFLILFCAGAVRWLYELVGYSPQLVIFAYIFATLIPFGNILPLAMEPMIRATQKMAKHSEADPVA